MEREINDGLKERFGVDKLIMIEINNYQVYLDRNAIRSNKNLNETEIKKWVLNYLARQPSVSRAVDMETLGEVAFNARQKEMIGNGYYPSRSGDILIMFLPQYIEGLATWAPHTELGIRMTIIYLYCGMVGI